MTNNEAIETLKVAKSEIEWEYPMDYQIALDKAIKALEQESVLDKVKVEIMDCLNALYNLEKSGLNIYAPNEISGRKLTYHQCLEILDKYKAESEDEE